MKKLLSLEEFTNTAFYNAGLAEDLLFVLPKVAQEGIIGLNKVGHDNIILGHLDPITKEFRLMEFKEEFGIPQEYRAGDCIRVAYSIKAYNGMYGIEEVYTSSRVGISAAKKKTLAGEIKVDKTTTVLCHGQSVLVTAPPEGGKSFMTAKIMDEIKESHDSEYRTLFGERKDDDLGGVTVNTDSSAPIGVQMYNLYRELTLALYDVHKGKKVSFALDSLTRLVEQLSSAHADSHMLSGGISSIVKKMTGDLFRMSGETPNGGILTIVGTSLWARSNNSWKAVYSELSSIATAEFFPAIRSGVQNSSRRIPDDWREHKTVFRILNFEFC